MAKPRNRTAAPAAAPAPAAETPLLHLADGETAAAPAAAAKAAPPGWLSFGRRHYNAQGELINDAAI